MFKYKYTKSLMFRSQRAHIRTTTLLLNARVGSQSMSSIDKCTHGFRLSDVIVLVLGADLRDAFIGGCCTFSVYTFGEDLGLPGLVFRFGINVIVLSLGLSLWPALSLPSLELLDEEDDDIGGAV